MPCCFILCFIFFMYRCRSTDCDSSAGLYTLGWGHQGRGGCVLWVSCPGESPVAEIILVARCKYSLFFVPTVLCIGTAFPARPLIILRETRILNTIKIVANTTHQKQVIRQYFTWPKGWPVEGKWRAHCWFVTNPHPLNNLYRNREIITQIRINGDLNNSPVQVDELFTYVINLHC